MIEEDLPIQVEVIELSDGIVVKSYDFITGYTLEGEIE